MCVCVVCETGCVYSVDEHGRSVHLLTVEGRVQKLCYLERRAVLAVVTDSLLLSQFRLGPEGGAQELSKVTANQNAQNYPALLSIIPAYRLSKDLCSHE